MTWRVEAGIHMPTLQVLRDLAQALGVTLSELLEGVDQAPPTPAVTARRSA